MRQVGGAAGVGAAFLEESFTRDTAACRRYEKPAMAVLKALLPLPGSQLKTVTPLPGPPPVVEQSFPEPPAEAPPPAIVAEVPLADPEAPEPAPPPVTKIVREIKTMLIEVPLCDNPPGLDGTPRSCRTSSRLT